MLTVTRITPRQVLARTKRGERVAFVDARDPAQRAASAWRISGAVEAGLDTLLADASRVERSGPVVVYGQDGAEPDLPRVAKRLQALGFREVRLLAGGIDAWAGERLAVEPSGARA